MRWSSVKTEDFWIFDPGSDLPAAAGALRDFIKSVPGVRECDVYNPLSGKLSFTVISGVFDEPGAEFELHAGHLLVLSARDWCVRWLSAERARRLVKLAVRPCLFEASLEDCDEAFEALKDIYMYDRLSPVRGLLVALLRHRRLADLQIFTERRAGI